MSEPTRPETQLGIADFEKRLNAAGINIVQQHRNFKRNSIYFALGDTRNQTDIVLSEEFLDDLPNTKEYQAMVDSYARAAAGRLKCGSPEIFYCQSGFAIQISFRWPIQSAIYNNELKTFLLVDVRNTVDGKVAKCSVMLGGGRVFAVAVQAVNSIRTAVDRGQIMFYEPSFHQEVYQRVETKQQTQQQHSEQDVERFVAGKAYTLGFMAVDETSDVWAVDPWDAQYLGVTEKNLALAKRVLRANGLLQEGAGPDYARPTDKLLAEHSSRTREESPLDRAREKLSHKSPAAKDELLKDLQHVVKQHGTFALIVLDVDNFKSVNDTKGHLEGNACLDKFIGAVETVVGRKGRVYRWGGDEFAICLPDFSTTEALTTAERIRSGVEQAKAGGDIEVTTSIGVCGSDSTDSKSPEELFDFADKAMYQSKHTGKNRVTAWPLSSTGTKVENTPTKRLGEQERRKLAESVVLSIKTDNGHHRNYTIRIKNHSKEIDVAIKRISLWSDDQRVSSPVSRPDGANWTVGAEREIPINFEAGEDVSHRLWMLAGSPPKDAYLTPRHLRGHFDTKVLVEITYEVLEIEKTYSEIGSVQVDPTNHAITGL